MTTIVGWDLGGANLKLARLEGGRVTRVAQIPCPVIPDRSKFDQALGEALELCPTGEPVRHAVTMTAELSDVFATRQEGVAYLVAMMRNAVGAMRLSIYAGSAGFLAPDLAVARALEVASANWHASAMLAAAHCRDGLLIDVGTTTTDLVPLKAGVPASRGVTDGERMTEGELVYTGVVRTPVMAVAREAPFKGRAQGIAAERFATMADVYRLTGELADDADPYPPADLRGKSMEESAARLARMLGRDASEAELAEWVEMARHFAECQLAGIQAAARHLLAREQLGEQSAVIGAGCGRFLAKRLAARLGLSYCNFADMIDCTPEAREMTARCAPAVAVALLGAHPLSPVERGGEGEAEQARS